MSTILVLDDDAADNELIRRVATDSDHTVIASVTIEDFEFQMTQQPIDLVIISLTTIRDQDMTRLQPILQQAPAAKIFAVSSFQRATGLTTLLRAESLGAHHLLAKPIDPRQLRRCFEATFPQPAQQD